MPGSEPSGLFLQGVDAGYGGRPVLRGVTLHAPPGRITGLIGPNGSGKTTVVRVASRGLRPAAGRVAAGGIDPYTVSARRAARLVAVVPQEMAPVFSFSVLEVVLMGRSPYLSPWGGGRQEDWVLARRAMEATNVQHLADRPIEELSGGERQRVVLAQALAQDAPVLLLDEPTTHLDVRHLLDLLAMVRGLVRREDRSVLAIFHDLNLASAHCDRIYALASGRVVAEGVPESILTREFLADVFGIEAEVTTSPATGRPTVAPTPAVAAERPLAGAPRVHVVGGAGRASGILRALAERAYDVTAGVLHAGDTDAAVAERLDLLRVTVPPFSPVDPRSAADCLRMMEGAEAVVVCDAPFGPGNVENLRLALQARRHGVRIVLVERSPIEERDFTEGEATSLWRVLRGLAETVTSEEEAVRAVAGERTSRLR